jgi:hypothetical protein
LSTAEVKARMEGGILLRGQMLSDRSVGWSKQREEWRPVVVEKLRMGLDNWPQIVGARSQQPLLPL